MDVQAAIIRPARNAAQRQAFGTLVVPTCLTAVALGAIAAGLLLWRRLAGAISQPVPWSALAIMGCAMAAYAVAVRLSWFRFGRNASPSVTERSLLDDLVITIPSLSFIVAAASLSIVGTQAIGLLLLWSLPLCVEFVMALRAFRSRNLRRSRQAVELQIPVHPIDSIDEPPAENPADDQHLRFDPPHEPPEPHWPAEDVSQQLTRRRTAEGTDSMHLWMRVDVEADARIGIAHLAFCPPFEGTPEVLFEQADGPEASIKLGQTLPYGARFEVKLASVAPTEQSVLLEVFVQHSRSEASLSR